MIQQNMQNPQLQQEMRMLQEKIEGRKAVLVSGNDERLCMMKRKKLVHSMIMTQLLH
jgi:calcineurin-like phosphoesterase family protein